ncbi:MAG: protein kinase domain-containing protein [Anaerolineae bacterium]
MIGRVIKGKYKIYDEVGSGGFATVYLGRNMDTNEIVAIKVLGDQYTREPRYLERFRREAGLAERLQHKNVVRILDHGIENGLHFLVMEFVEGLTLDQVIERRGRIPVEEALSYAKQACAGLDAAHRAGVVHRDIKPANLMITPGGTVKIMDFGIARMESMVGLTQSGMFMGTPRYISPEMARGTGADIRADLYALGLLMYEMLTGSPPFDADNPWAVLRQQIEEQLPPVRQARPDVPQWLEAVIARAAAKDPAQRFQSPAEMLAALEQQTVRPVNVPQAPPPSRAGAATMVKPRPAARRTSRGLVFGLAAAAIVVALGLVAFLVFGLGGGDTTPTPRPSQVAVAANNTAAPLSTNTPVVVVVTSTPEDTPTPTDTSPPTEVPASDTPLPTEAPPTEMPAPTEVPPTNTPQPTDTSPPTVAATRGPTATPRPSDTPTNPPPPPVSGRIAYSAGGSLHIADVATGRDTVAAIANMRQPDFRSDGALVIAKGFQGDKTSLWTIDANSGAFVREQSPFTNDFRPFWSPDGTRFVYDSLHQGLGNSTLYQNQLDSNADQLMHYNDQAIIGTSPVWMHDDFVAFTGCDYWPGGTGGAKCGIYRMPSWNDRPQLIYPGDLTLRATDNYGSNLLLMSQESGNWEVYVMGNQGGAARNLSNSPNSNDGLGTFSPDGKMVAFASNRGGGWAIWAVKLDGTGVTKLFDLPAALTGNWTEEHISWGP